MARKLRIGDTCPDCGWFWNSMQCQGAHDPDPKARMWTKPEWAGYRRSGRKPAWDRS